MKKGFTVSPMSQEISLKPGETYRGYILVSNPADATEDFQYKVTANPFSITGDNYETDFKTMSDWSRIVSWTTIENESGTLKPNDTKKVYFTIEVPKNAPGGGQYMMFALTADDSVSADGATVSDVFEMASLVYADVPGEIKHEGQILDNQITGFVVSGSPKVITKISNTGNVHETANVTITVKNNFNGETVFPKDASNNTFESVIMPETTREISRDLTNLPQLGVFEVTETVSYLGNETSITSVMVICPIWFLCLIFATIGSVIAMVFYGRYLKHKKNKKVVDF